MQKQSHTSISCEYWCHNCEKYYKPKQFANYCLKCDSDAIEIIQNETKTSQKESLSKFQIYQIEDNKRQEGQNVLGVLQNFDRPNYQVTTTISVIQSVSIGPQDIPQGSYLGGLLRQLMMSDNRLTPASQTQIQRLQKINKVSQCSICQHQEEQMGEQQPEIIEQRLDCGVKLPCSHTFHTQCIKPWFQRTNTCPICRTNISNQN